MPTLPDNLTIRRARDSDLPEIAKMHFASYPGISMTLEDRISHFRDDPRISLEDNWVCERTDRLVGIFALYSFQMYRAGSLIPIGGIGRVAVTPEARLEKIAYWLMVKAVQIMDQNGTPISLLHPFRHSFYYNLGWGLAEQVRFYRISPSDIPVYPERAKMKPVVTNEDMEEVMACYHRFAALRNGLLVRDDPVWYEHILKNNLIYSFRSSDTGEVEGYIIYQYQTDPKEQSFTVSNLAVREIIWTTNRALKGILGFLSSQRDQIMAIEYNDHFELPLEHLLKDSLMVDGKRSMMLGAETAIIGSGLMGRIIQLRRVLGAGKLGNGNGRVTLNIKDDLNPEYSIPLTIEIEDGKVSFPSRKSASISLSTNIATFSSIYWGALSLKDAVFFGKVEIEGKGDRSFLKEVFTFPRSVCLDYF